MYIIVERKLDIPSHLQAEDHFDKCKDLDLAVSQMVTFICETGYSDVEFRNNPPLNTVDENGDRQIALIDLEEMGSSIEGLFGSSLKRGLVGCVSKEQGRIVEEQAQKHGIDSSLFIDA